MCEVGDDDTGLGTALQTGAELQTNEVFVLVF